MLPIADTRTYQLSRFTIREQPRRDNPAFPQFLIFLDGKLIGTQASRPCESDAEWHLARSGQYARADESQAYCKDYGRKFTIPKGGRPTNAERARRAALTPPEEEENTLA